MNRIGYGKKLLIALVATVAAFGQQSPPYEGERSTTLQASDDQGVLPTQVDPEDRNHGVARVSLLNGDVSVRRGDSGDFVAAAVNAPLLALDSVQTGISSRAEVQLDTENRVRFANDTEARFSQLTADRAQVQIARGTLSWSVLADGGLQGEIATPSVAIRPLGRGLYRISVLADGTSEITVRAGALEVFTPRGVERVEPGQTMFARGGVDNPEFQTGAALAQDEWDRFNERRDREVQTSQSYNYVSRDIAGAEDLDNYGQWNTDPTYGQVWTPRVASDWAPYRLGRWSNEDYYGWTWVSADPWGWAPYHYGSWFHGGYGWSWCPGPRYSHYYYRPALVAFVGFGHGGGVGFGGWGFGNVGWVPLAPYELFHPWYGRGYGRGGNFGRSVSVVNNQNIYNLYRNARVNSGVTSIGSRDFASGNFGRNSSVGFGQLQQAGAVRGQMPFTPNSNHLRFNDRQTSVQSRTDFGRTRFANYSASTAQSSTRYVPQQKSFGSFGRPSVPAQQNGQSNSGNYNWNRFGNPGTSAPVSRPQQPQTGSFGRQLAAPNYPQSTGGGSNSWQRFGDPGGSRPNYGASRPSSSVGDYRQSIPRQPQFGRGSSSAVQVAPPVVHERNSGFSRPSYNQPPPERGNNRFSGSSQPSPSYNRPSYRQPSSDARPSFQQQRSEPNRGNGGGDRSRDSGSRGHR